MACLLAGLSGCSATARGAAAQAATAPPTAAAAAGRAGGTDGRPSGGDTTEESKALARGIAEAFRARKQAAPATDGALSAAAEALARRAADEGARAATAPSRVSRAVSDAEGFDPHPRAIAARAADASAAVALLLARDDLAGEPATHGGFGVVRGSRGAAAVVLLVERKAALSKFPRRVEPGEARPLSGSVTFPRHGPRVYVTGPAGTLQPRQRSQPKGDRFEAQLQFPEPGAYTVEVVATSVKGPEVVALFTVQAGEEGGGQEAEDPRGERDDLVVAEAEVLSAIQQRRRGERLSPFARDAALDAVATSHAREMARLDYFAHVSPVSGDLRRRLERADYPYLKIAENLGEAETALEAHRLIEASPGHLANLLDADLTRLGLGTAKVRRGGVDNIVLVEVFALPAR